MTGITQAQLAIAQFAERFTPELKRRVALFALTSIAIGLLALIVLTLLKATYEPFVWTVLVLTGATYGWYARGELTFPDPAIYPFDDTEEAE